MAFGMQDVLLEPYGGQVLHMSVGDTTYLTASLAFGGLTGFSIVSVVLSRGADPFRMAIAGALTGIPSFALVILAATVAGHGFGQVPGAASVPLFVIGAVGIGLGGGLFGHGTLTATMHSAPTEQVGLALGAWGAVQATCAGIAVAVDGLLSDAVHALARRGDLGVSLAGDTTGYLAVYSLEMVMLAATTYLMIALVGRSERVDGAGTFSRRDASAADLVLESSALR